MIDTVVLRLHDLRKYDLLIQRLRLKRNKGYTLAKGSWETEEAQRMRKMGFRKPKDLLNIMEINRTGEHIVTTEVSKQVNSSGHYAFAYRIDHSRDFIEFNFSIPKYRFGSNVLMFVEHLSDPHFSYNKNRTLIHNIKRCISSFFLFIKYFLHNEFILESIDLMDVEINRIDLCFNQVFKSKEDAMLYFGYQKRLRKKYSREEDGGKTDYNTSFMYSTKRSSSKIYHKGTEYRKHDLKQHLKINREKGFEYFRTGAYQKFADRILRYEVTIRSSELNYLFKHKIFRKYCPFFKIQYRDYMKTENAIKRNDRIAKHAGELTANEKRDFLENHPYEKIMPDARANYKYVVQLMSRITYFMMKVDEADKIYNSVTTVNHLCSRAPFSRELLSLCFKKLLGFMGEFKIKELPDEDKIGLLVDQYNNTHRTKLLKSSMIEFYLLLVKHGSFKEAAIFARKDRATMFRFKKKFKQLGITENNVQPDKNLSIPKASFDFIGYHDFLLYDNDLLRPIKTQYYGLYSSDK